jgi:hypothetical protein
LLIATSTAFSSLADLGRDTGKKGWIREKSAPDTIQSKFFNGWISSIGKIGVVLGIVVLLSLF